MSGLQEELAGLLPTKASRLVALATAPAAVGGFYLAHELSPLWPKSTQAEIVLAQILALAAIGLLGALIVLILVLREYHAVSEELSFLQNAPASPPSRRSFFDPLPTPTSIPLPKEMDPVQIASLVGVFHYPDTLTSKLAKAMNRPQQEVLYQLELLEKLLLVQGRYSGLGKQWSLTHQGRKYVLENGLANK